MSASSKSLTDYSSDRAIKKIQPCPCYSGFATTLILLLLLFSATAATAMILDDPNLLPEPEPDDDFLTHKREMVAPKRREEDDHMLIRAGAEAEVVGLLQLLGPEDLIYDPKSQLIYTGCADGWIKQITLNNSAAGHSVVHNLIFVGGRPLGLALGHHHNFIVANADQGLQNVSMDGKVKVLANETNGVRFKLTDGVDVAKDGTIYFTDASYKYNLQNFIYDVLEGKPHGRFMSYHPSTKKTKVLIDGLYFANGVAVSPNQNYVVFCETVKRRCRKYYIRGKKRGTVANFTDKLPAMPDNIHYDGDGHYWIALTTGMTESRDLALSYPRMEKNNGGVIVVDLEGKPISRYYDADLCLVSSAIKVGDHLYCGSLINPFILRLNITEKM